MKFLGEAMKQRAIAERRKQALEEKNVSTGEALTGYAIHFAGMFAEEKIKEYTRDKMLSIQNNVIEKSAQYAGALNTSLNALVSEASKRPSDFTNNKFSENCKKIIENLDREYVHESTAGNQLLAKQKLAIKQKLLPKIMEADNLITKQHNADSSFIQDITIDPSIRKMGNFDITLISSEGIRKAIGIKEAEKISDEKKKELDNLYKSSHIKEQGKKNPISPNVNANDYVGLELYAYFLQKVNGDINKANEMMQKYHPIKQQIEMEYTNKYRDNRHEGAFELGIMEAEGNISTKRKIYAKEYKDYDTGDYSSREIGRRFGIIPEVPMGDDVIWDPDLLSEEYKRAGKIKNEDLRNQRKNYLDNLRKKDEIAKCEPHLRTILDMYPKCRGNTKLTKLVALNCVVKEGDNYVFKMLTEEKAKQIYNDFIENLLINLRNK